MTYYYLTRENLVFSETSPVTDVNVLKSTYDLPPESSRTDLEMDRSREYGRE